MKIKRYIYKKTKNALFNLIYRWEETIKTRNFFMTEIIQQKTNDLFKILMKY